MLNPQHLAVFASIVRAGSISKAAVQLGCGKSVLSRQLARLEEDLGARLIQRSTRKLTLTEIGEMVLLEAQQIERALVNIEQLAGQFQQEVKGRLRVTCPMAMGQRHLVPLLAEFTARYPLVEISLHVEDRLVDLIAEQIDVAIRVSHLEDSGLIARKLADSPRVLTASPAYLAQAGTPQTPDELPAHSCLVYTSGGRAFDEWTFIQADHVHKIRVRGQIQINDGMALAAAACSGAGILLIDRLLVDKELASGELIELLPQYTLRAGFPIYAVYPARDWLALKTAAFVAFLQERLFVSLPSRA
ncbi:LysR family transcriptional regulator [Undibacterium sp.]|jgi:DNA-binding transcriptional LysR family regulator|uniref:LysR family transcriptional regulator n=1 Tax=Undibacterium sp. TaxID=1914977 RepID=UPI002CA0671E|nr:LysR substrate-binding domain-containing protein [Undibacterium sp.]HTD03253.1 LysR substrate-binding domain-containing protein [Undibacterium sp.]